MALSSDTPSAAYVTYISHRYYCDSFVMLFNSIGPFYYCHISFLDKKITLSSIINSYKIMA
jgi:hypothetical protein